MLRRRQQHAEGSPMPFVWSSLRGLPSKVHRRLRLAARLRHTFLKQQCDMSVQRQRPEYERSALLVATTREAASLSSASQGLAVEWWWLLSLCYCQITIAQSAGYGDVPSTYHYCYRE
jgi:hypothetical protein